MIPAYNDDYLPIIQQKLACLFEIAADIRKIDIEKFCQKFLSSPVCRAFEEADPVLALGKSASELLGIILDEPPKPYETGSFASPEYWAGYTYAYMQWHFNTTYSALFSEFPCRQLLENYFPYHEMDIRHSVDLFSPRLKTQSPLKKLRTAKKLSQRELAILSGVPERSIKAYEQGAVDISKAQADTLYALSKALGCSMENLII